jgi:RNA polymerase sigma-70 factor, ECF subfamily
MEHWALIAGCFPQPMEHTEGKAALPAGPAWPQSIREFESLVELLQHRLVQYAVRRLHSREDAEDVVQEVLVQAYRERQRYRNVANAVPLLFRMVANRSTDLLRRRRRDGPPLESIAEPAAEGAAADPAREEARFRAVEQSLARLPRRQAEAIRLRIYGDLPFEDVAEAVGCSVPTVKSRFRYGVQKLRGYLGDPGGER